MANKAAQVNGFSSNGTAESYAVRQRRVGGHEDERNAALRQERYRVVWDVAAQAEIDERRVDRGHAGEGRSLSDTARGARWTS